MSVMQTNTKKLIPVDFDTSKYNIPLCPDLEYPSVCDTDSSS